MQNMETSMHENHLQVNEGGRERMSQGLSAGKTTVATVTVSLMTLVERPSNVSQITVVTTAQELSGKCA